MASMLRKVDARDQYIPFPMQAFLIGTTGEDGSDNFGLFCWLNCCWDGELCLSLCMDGNKATKSAIERTRRFTASLVDRDMLATAGAIASARGAEKRALVAALPKDRGELGIAYARESPLVFEAEVKQTVRLDGSDLFICRIASTLASDSLVGEPYGISSADAVVVAQQSFFSLHEASVIAASTTPSHYEIALKQQAESI